MVSEITWHFTANFFEFLLFCLSILPKIKSISKRPHSYLGMYVITSSKRHTSKHRNSAGVNNAFGLKHMESKSLHWLSRIHCYWWTHGPNHMLFRSTTRGTHKNEYIHVLCICYSLRLLAFNKATHALLVFCHPGHSSISIQHSFGIFWNFTTKLRVHLCQSSSVV